MRLTCLVLVFVILLAGGIPAFADCLIANKELKPVAARDAGGVYGRTVEEMANIFGSTDIFLPIYYADASQSRGAVYIANTTDAPDNVIYTWHSGRLYSFTFHPGVPEKLYYVDANQHNIYRVDLWSSWFAESSVYTHSTYVKDIAFALDTDGDLSLFFSEASGAAADGKIYKLADSSAALFYTVRLSDVGGSWAGDFTFDPQGNLYLSSGNHVPASIYKVSNGSGRIEEIFRDDRGSISGMAYRSGYLYYADWGTRIYRIDLSTMRRTAYYSNPSRGWISDVGFRDMITDPAQLPKAGTYGIYYPIPTTPIVARARK